MKSTAILFLLFVKTEPFILPSTTKRCIPLSNKRSLLQPLLLSSSTSDNEEEDNKSSSSAASSSFDEAGRKILDEENRELAASIGTDEDDEEFEQRSQEYEAIRQAIRARTADLGIEKSVVSAKLIEDAKKAKLEEIEQARKQAGGVSSSSSSPELDLSQITVGSLQNVASSTKDEEDFQIVFTDDLEKQFDELSEEEKNEIDPWWDKGWVEQSKYELTKIEFPDALTTLKESLLVLASVAFMTWVVVNFDEYLRVKFTEYGFIPKPEDIRRSFEGLELPPGWTDGMTDEDLANMK